MTPLALEQTEDAPRVVLDARNGVYEISGESRPENASAFYTPIMQWLDNLKSVLYWQKIEFHTPQNIDFSIRLDYFNSTSAKYIMDILLLLEKMKNDGQEVHVKWHYHSNDDDMKSAGEEYSRSLSTLNLEMVAIS